LIDVEHLDLEDSLCLVGLLGVGPVRDIGLLDSAIARPRSSAFGVDAYPTLELKATSLLHSLAAHHPLVDGNKRLAWLATVTFLDLNGHESDASDDEAYDLVLDVASGESDLETIANRLRVQSQND
jgi:death-on-curing protein